MWLVTSHTGCVSRNYEIMNHIHNFFPVTSHTGCVSRNLCFPHHRIHRKVTSHTGCVSRNRPVFTLLSPFLGHIPHGMCEQKYTWQDAFRARLSHIPHGMCEQKLDYTTSGETNLVTSHTGCVSRNLYATLSAIKLLLVTSHTGCVSRNKSRRF